MWWNGAYPISLISGGFGMDKFKKGYYGVVLDNKALFFNNKQTVYFFAFIINLYVYPEDLKPARLMPVSSLSELERGDIVLYKSLLSSEDNHLVKYYGTAEYDKDIGFFHFKNEQQVEIHSNDLGKHVFHMVGYY